MLTPQNFHMYQRECILHQLYHDDSMLWLQMGLGKTPITLTTIVDRMRAGQVQKTLIFAPLRVIQAVWAREARKWSHTQHLRFSVVHGTREKRTRALFSDADIYLINYEAMNWCAEILDHYYLSQDKPLPFQMVVYDEVSKLKNSTTLRMKGGNRDRKDKRGDPIKVHVTGWRKMIPHFKYRTGLTGTPASNGYLDLHGQYLAVDGGQRLGEFVTGYKDNYFMSDYSGWKYTPTVIGKEFIENNIADITKKMDSVDYLDMPPLKIVNMMVDMPASTWKAYKELEKKMFTRLDSGAEIEVFSKSSISNKCLQFCNGSPYIGETKTWDELHDVKLDALEEVLEEAAGAPVLCSYTYKSDAARIMQKFKKKYNPVNLTAAASKDTGKIIDRWNSGEIRLLIGHPACLHPSTQVLTERRGWVKIIEVRSDERIFDGVEFVSHKGCSYSGYREVTDAFGITMTPDHKLLIDGEWVEAINVRDTKEVRQKALYKYEGANTRLGEMFKVSDRVRDDSPERSEAQPEPVFSLPPMHTGQIPQYDRYSDARDMVRADAQGEGRDRPKLWWTWDRCVRRVGIFRELSLRYVRELFGKFDDRESRREQTLLQRELCMGDDVRPAEQQANNSTCHVPWCADASRGISPPVRYQQDDADLTDEQGYDRRRSGDRCEGIALWEEHRKNERGETTKAHVYDLVDCGPRHRFLVRNNNGEVFVSHNSMGHGIDGLQESGSILVWFGMNWSLELYEQMCGRLNRQGQTQSVSIIRILCNDTVDIAVADAIARKTDDQEGLKSALQRYRDGITTNDLEVNFY